MNVLGVHVRMAEGAVTVLTPTVVCAEQVTPVLGVKLVSNGEGLSNIQVHIGIVNVYENTHTGMNYWVTRI